MKHNSQKTTNYKILAAIVFLLWVAAKFQDQYFR